MDHTTPYSQVSYTAWILGQTSAWLGILLIFFYGFDVVILQAHRIYAESLGEVAATADFWAPPFGPPLLGMGIATLAWLVSSHQGLTTPAPVVVGFGLNLIALFLAMMALH